MFLHNNMVCNGLELNMSLFFYSLETFLPLINLRDIDLCWLDTIRAKGFLNVTIAC